MLTVPLRLAVSVGPSVTFLVADTQLYKRLCPSVGWSVGWLVGWSVEVIELKSGKTRISAPAHPSATGGRVSGLVITKLHRILLNSGKSMRTKTKTEDERILKKEKLSSL